VAETLNDKVLVEILVLLKVHGLHDAHVANDDARLTATAHQEVARGHRTVLFHHNRDRVLNAAFPLRLEISSHEREERAKTRNKQGVNYQIGCRSLRLVELELAIRDQCTPKLDVAEGEENEVDEAV